MTAGPMAMAASVLGATEPTASPRDADVKDSSVSIARNLANLVAPCTEPSNCVDRQREGETVSRIKVGTAVPQ